MTYVTLKRVVVLSFKQGARTEVKKTIQLKNGTSVHPDGSYSLTGKPSMQLKNGEGMGMNGNVFQSGSMHHGAVRLPVKCVVKQ